MSVDVSYNPRDGRALGERAHTSSEDVHQALREAEAAATGLATASPSARTSWLRSLAHAVEADAESLVALADEETALGSDRLRGELAKTAAQLRFYAEVTEEGRWLDVSIDHLPDGTDLRRVRMPVGPVAIFTASNFPFAFGVLGHDTAAALGVGAPALVKGHPAHPRLTAALSELARRTLAEAGAPTGAFATVTGLDNGLALVDAPGVRAVAFTGSQQGGMALVQRAQDRPRPIPVFAEMGTVNPGVVTPAAAHDRLPEVLAGFVGSFTLGRGQFCTKPGLLLLPGSAVDRAAALLREALSSQMPGQMLTAGMADGYNDRLADMIAAGAEIVAQGPFAESGFATGSTVLQVPASDLTPHSPFLAECFGPLALLVAYESIDEAREVLSTTMQPSLAGSVISGGPDDPDTATFVASMAPQVGRVVVDGWPTGVATTWSQQHGGPWPATSRPEATSVGAGAFDRFTRPVAFQNAPSSALPGSLHDANPWDVPRRVDGVVDWPSSRTSQPEESR